eukprot:1525953-Amphidinium_carterae.1
MLKGSSACNTMDPCGLRQVDQSVYPNWRILEGLDRSVRNVSKCMCVCQSQSNYSTMRPAPFTIRPNNSERVRMAHIYAQIAESSQDLVNDTVLESATRAVEQLPPRWPGAQG